jgi:hypothetical protein
MRHHQAQLDMESLQNVGLPRLGNDKSWPCKVKGCDRLQENIKTAAMLL